MGNRSYDSAIYDVNQRMDFPKICTMGACTAAAATAKPANTADIAKLSFFNNIKLTGMHAYCVGAKDADARVTGEIRVQDGTTLKAHCDLPVGTVAAEAIITGSVDSALCTAGELQIDLGVDAGVTGTAGTVASMGNYYVTLAYQESFEYT